MITLNEFIDYINFDIEGAKITKKRFINWLLLEGIITQPELSYQVEPLFESLLNIEDGVIFITDEGSDYFFEEFKKGAIDDLFYF